MIKKLVSCLICVILLAAFIPFTASAANTAEFKVCIANQDEKSITVTLDFANGTGFCAFDASIEYDTLKLGLESCQFSSGFASYVKAVEKKGGMTIYNINSKNNPIKVSSAGTVPFEKAGNDGSVIKMNFSKINGTNLSENDIKVTIENCQTEKFEDIKTKLVYDLKNGSSSSANDQTAPSATVAPEDKEDTANNDKTTSSQAVTETTQNNTEKNQGTDSDNNITTSESAKTNAQAGKGVSNSKKTVIVIFCAVIVVACTGAVIYMIAKNKKEKIDEFER